MHRNKIGMLLVVALFVQCRSPSNNVGGPIGAGADGLDASAGDGFSGTEAVDGPRQPSKPGLKDLPGAKNLMVGAAADFPQLCTKPLAGKKKCHPDAGDHIKVLLREHNTMVTGMDMKWEIIHPRKDGYAFDTADFVVDFAKQNNLQIRGHTLVWHKQNPTWLFPKNPKKDGCGQWTKVQLLSILESHIKQVAGHFKGKLESWDVVNEPFRDSQSGGDNKHFLKSCWYQLIGEEYIEKAFRWAREADPQVKLILNEDRAEEVNSESDRMYKHVKLLQSKGVPIDGVGFQFHLNMADYSTTADLDKSFKSMDANIRRFHELGLEIYFTEVDVGILGKGTSAKHEQHADIYRRIFELARKHSSVKAVLMWGVTDKYSWLPSLGKDLGYTESYGQGLLFDKQYHPKPAYFAVQKVLMN